MSQQFFDTFDSVWNDNKKIVYVAESVLKNITTAH